ncbi:MAG: hypothetical protein PHV74_08005 [Dehalococcoidia bacterium]|nr:hypothetical protein [Dehalococcoidia bacterium]
MAKGPRIPKNKKAQIIEIALSPQNRQKDRTSLAKDIAKKLWPHPDDIPPDIGTIEKYISAARNPQKWPEDKPWSLAYASEIPFAALPVVLEVWRDMQIKGKPLSRRGAKWAAILSAKITEPWILSYWANLYSDRELVSAILNQDMDTTDLDIIWSTHPWEYATLILTGELDKSTLSRSYPIDNNGRITAAGHEGAPFGQAAGIIEIDRHTVRASSDKLESLLILLCKRESPDAAELWKQLEPIELSPVAERVYELWLRQVITLLAESQTILSEVEMSDLIIQLRKWVKDRDRDIPPNTFWHTIFDDKPYDFDKIVRKLDWIPDRILVMVNRNIPFGG